MIMSFHQIFLIRAFCLYEYKCVPDRIYFECIRGQEHSTLAGLN